MRRSTAAFSTVTLCLAISAAHAEAPTEAATAPNRVRVEPAEIAIGVFYGGHDVEVTADAPAEAELAFRLVGPSEPLTLKKKRKKFGFLWMNAGEVEFPELPILYLLRSTKSPSDLGPLETRTHHGIGFDALEARLPDDAADARELFDEMVKLKKRDDLYASSVGDVSFSEADGGNRQATAHLFLPAKSPVGDYDVEVFAFQNGECESLGAAVVHLERGHAVAVITNMVHEHSLLYGCIAVVIAVIAGLGTGLIFGKGGSH